MAYLMAQQRWWQGIRPIPALLSLGAHLALVGGGIWMGTTTPQLASAPPPQVVSVSLVQQQAVVATPEAPVERPPEPLPEPPPPPEPTPKPRPAPKPEPVSEPPPAPVEPAQEPPAEPVESSSSPLETAGSDTVQESEEALIEPAFQADYLHNPRPGYPRISRRMGEQGEVILRVLVNPEGQPKQVTLHESSGHQRLDQAALEVVERWQFVPARRGIRTVEAWVIVPIVFSLGG